MKTTLLSSLLATALLAAVPATGALAQSRPAAAATQGAGTSVLATSNRIIDTLQARRAEFRRDNKALRQFIQTEMDRTFDRDYAARLVLGRHARGASEAQVRLFADAMADNLMARYGSALLEIDGKPQFRLKGESPLPGNRGVKVSTELLRRGTDVTPVDYLMRQVDGRWKIFDVMIEGISYVQTFKNQFDAPLAQKGIEQVARDLRSGKLQAGTDNARSR